MLTCTTIAGMPLWAILLVWWAIGVIACVVAMRGSNESIDVAAVVIIAVMAASGFLVVLLAILGWADEKIGRHWGEIVIVPQRRMRKW